MSNVYFMWPRRESNPDLAFRKRLFYPLNYEAVPGPRRPDVCAQQGLNLRPMDYESTALTD